MTTAPLTVVFDPDAMAGHARAYAAHRAALAALPGSFRVVTDQPADVFATVAAGTGWLERIAPALHGPVRAVLIAGLDPSALPGLRDLAALAADKRLIAAVASGYADDAAWQATVPEARHDLEALTLIDAVAAVPAGGTLFDALMDQLALVESLAGPLERTRALSVTAGHYVLAGEAGSVTVSLSGTACTAEPGSLEIDLVGRQARWHVEFSSAAAAFPAAITRHDADGARTRRPLFQGGSGPAGCVCTRKSTLRSSI